VCHFDPLISLLHRFLHTFFASVPFFISAIHFCIGAFFVCHLHGEPHRCHFHFIPSLVLALFFNLYHYCYILIQNYAVFSAVELHLCHFCNSFLQTISALALFFCHLSQKRRSREKAERQLTEKAEPSRTSKRQSREQHQRHISHSQTAEPRELSTSHAAQ